MDFLGEPDAPLVEAYVKGLEEASERERESRAMFVARLQASTVSFTIPEVLALMNDCDFLASLS